MQAFAHGSHCAGLQEDIQVALATGSGNCGGAFGGTVSNVECGMWNVEWLPLAMWNVECGMVAVGNVEC